MFSDKLVSANVSKEAARFVSGLAASLFPRLQHELLGPALYKVGIVSPTSRNQSISCQVFSARSGEILGTLEVQLQPKG